MGINSINSISEEVKRRKRTWLGHALRMNKTRLSHAALRCAPPGKTEKEGEANGHLEKDHRRDEAWEDLE